MCRRDLLISWSFRAICIIFLFLLVGCGYHLLGRGKPLGEINTITVPFFVNESKERPRASVLRSELESILTPPFSEELANSRFVKVVDKEGEAELKGVIKRHILVPLSFNSMDVVQEYKITIVLYLSIIKEGKVFWEGELSDSEEFVASEDIDIFRANEEKALKEIAVELAKIFKERVVEDF